jgi:hypothetical protein
MKVCATITASMVKGMDTPNRRSAPGQPGAAERQQQGQPATVGGSTIGSATGSSTSRLPRKCRVARDVSHRRANPTTSAVAAELVTRLSHSAWSTAGSRERASRRAGSTRNRGEERPRSSSKRAAERAANASTRPRGRPAPAAGRLVLPAGAGMGRKPCRWSSLALARDSSPTNASAAPPSRASSAAMG